MSADMEQVPVLQVREATLVERGFGPISFSAGVGELILLCGRSGSGKSTLCQLICSRREPDSGSVESAPGYSVGYISHDFENQLLGSTVAEELELGVEEPTAALRLQPALQKLVSSLEDRFACDPHDLSRADQQILLLCSLVRAGAGVLVLDESLSYLDPRQWSDFLAVLAQLSKAGITCLIVSHQIEALAGVNRVLALEEGRLYYDGPAGEFSTTLRERAGLTSSAETSLLERAPREMDTGTFILGFQERSSLTLSRGQAFVVGGYAGSGKSRVLDALFDGDGEGLWTLGGPESKRCLLRQVAGPSFWRGSLEREWAASFGSFGKPAPEFAALLKSSIPDSWWKKSPRQLSNGQLRFFGALCLMAQNPQLLFLEHPFLGLDGDLRETLLRCFKLYLELGGCMLITTDDPKQVAQLADLAVWLDEGRVVWSGVPGDAEWDRTVRPYPTNTI